MSLGQVYGAIRSGAIRVNGRKTSPHHRLRDDEALSARTDLPISRLAETHGAQDEARGLSAPDPLDGHIAFENEYIVVVAKSRGELVHGAGSLEHDVRRHLSKRPARGVSFRPGPVHRLDRNTSGLVVYAASLRGAQRMSEAIQAGGLTKRYAAVVQGRIGGPAVWRDPLRRNRDAQRTVADPLGLASETRVEPITARNGVTLVEIELTTGRTHQIRAHAQIHGHPIMGDRKYGGGSTRGGYILHAGFLELSAQFADVGFRRLWQRLPPEPATRVATLFGQVGLDRLYERWSQ